MATESQHFITKEEQLVFCRRKIVIYIQEKVTESKF